MDIFLCSNFLRILIICIIVFIIGLIYNIIRCTHIHNQVKSLFQIIGAYNFIIIDEARLLNDEGDKTDEVDAYVIRENRIPYDVVDYVSALNNVWRWDVYKTIDKKILHKINLKNDEILKLLLKSGDIEK